MSIDNNAPLFCAIFGAHIFFLHPLFQCTFFFFFLFLAALLAVIVRALVALRFDVLFSICIVVFIFFFFIFHIMSVCVLGCSRSGANMAVCGELAR